MIINISTETSNTVMFSSLLGIHTLKVILFLTCSNHSLRLKGI